MKYILCAIIFLLFWAVVHGGKKYAYEQEPPRPDERGTAGNCDPVYCDDYYDHDVSGLLEED